MYQYRKPVRPPILARQYQRRPIALLTAQRKPDGKHRYSANQIATLVDGNRNAVMARVKELRAGAPVVFRPLTPERQQLREQLQSDQR